MPIDSQTSLHPKDLHNGYSITFYPFRSSCAAFEVRGFSFYLGENMPKLEQAIVCMSIFGNSPIGPTKDPRIVADGSNYFGWVPNLIGICKESNLTNINTPILTKHGWKIIPFGTSPHYDQSYRLVMLMKMPKKGPHSQCQPTEDFYNKFYRPDD